MDPGRAPRGSVRRAPDRGAADRRGRAARRAALGPLPPVPERRAARDLARRSAARGRDAARGRRGAPGDRDDARRPPRRHGDLRAVGQRLFVRGASVGRQDVSVRRVRPHPAGGVRARCAGRCGGVRLDRGSRPDDPRPGGSSPDLRQGRCELRRDARGGRPRRRRRSRVPGMGRRRTDPRLEVRPHRRVHVDPLCRRLRGAVRHRWPCSARRTRGSRSTWRTTRAPRVCCTASGRSSVASWGPARLAGCVPGRSSDLSAGLASANDDRRSAHSSSSSPRSSRGSSGPLRARNVGRPRPREALRAAALPARPPRTRTHRSST